VLQKAGGLHRFKGGQPILTDSAATDFFLAGTRKITEEGVLFQSHIDARAFIYTRIGHDIQRAIGADIIMAFDECPPYPTHYTYAEKSMHLTHRWLDRVSPSLTKRRIKYGIPNLFPLYRAAPIPISQGFVRNIASKDATVMPSAA